MFNKFFRTNFQLITYIFVWILFAWLQTVSLRNISPLEFTKLLSDNLAYSTVYAVIGMLILSLVKFGNFELLSTHQRRLNYAAVIVLATMLTVGIGCLFEYYVLGDELAKQLIPFIALRVLISFLLYFLLVVSFILFVSKMKIEQNELEPIENSQKEVGEPVEEKEKTVIDQVAVKTGTKIHIILIPDIIYIQADGDYVQIYSTSGRYMKEQTLKYFEEHLPNNLFVRVHRSSIVNVQSILRIELYDKQSQQLALKNNHQIKISQAGYKLLRTKLNV